MSDDVRCYAPTPVLQDLVTDEIVDDALTLWTGDKWGPKHDVDEHDEYQVDMRSSMRAVLEAAIKASQAKPTEGRTEPKGGWCQTPAKCMFCGKVRDIAVWLGDKYVAACQQCVEDCGLSDEAGTNASPSSVAPLLTDDGIKHRVIEYHIEGQQPGASCVKTCAAYENGIRWARDHYEKHLRGEA